MGIIFHVLLSKTAPHWQRTISWEKNVDTPSTQQLLHCSNPVPGNVSKVAKLTGMAQSWMRVHRSGGPCRTLEWVFEGRVDNPPPPLGVMTPMRPAHA